MPNWAGVVPKERMNETNNAPPTKRIPASELNKRKARTTR
jgi:hypothetical protein